MQLQIISLKSNGNLPKSTSFWKIAYVYSAKYRQMAQIHLFYRSYTGICEHKASLHFLPLFTKSTKNLPVFGDLTGFA